MFVESDFMNKGFLRHVPMAQYIVIPAPLNWLIYILTGFSLLVQVYRPLIHKLQELSSMYRMLSPLSIRFARSTVNFAITDYERFLFSCWYRKLTTLYLMLFFL
jgi:hypothetical protein